ncbi:MAG: HAD-IA family hydrolase [Candidatus Cloacimonetes bacterium]|nr:HAD-IA family hydrolase [Candidatus Cloacimonadota bacterium]
MKKITHIIFDLSEVLVSGLVGIEEEISSLTGVPQDQILRKFGGNNLILLCKNKMTENEYLNRLIKRENWSCSKKQLATIIRNNFHHIFDCMDDLIVKLSEEYTCILLSDHAREWIEYIEEYHEFLKMFKYRLYSFMTGHIKDEEHNFQKILNDLHINAQNCIFIDDSESNISTAKKCGIHSILFQGHEKLVSDLARLGIHP